MFLNRAFKEHYSQIIYLHASGEDCFEADLRGAFASLAPGLDTVDLRPVGGALRDRRALLVLSGTQAIDAAHRRGKRPSILRLFEHLQDLSRRADWSAPPCVLACGPSSELGRAVSRTDGAILKGRSDWLRVDEPSPFLEAQWTRFCELRGVDPYKAVGSRLRRASWHYEVARGPALPSYHINVRLRAFFASNLDNPAFFDPTGGFEALAGMPETELPIDIWLFKKATEDALRHYVTSRPGDRDIRYLRLLSTAKHWLTNGALQELVRRFPPDGRGERTISAVGKYEEIIARPVPGWVHRTNSGTFLGIAVKALLQDEWRTGPNSCERSIAHYRVATRIWDRRDDKAFLAQEFPYRPHWGRPRIHLLAEVIRHLVRATDLRPEAVGPLQPRSNSHDFVDPPDAGIGGCDPFQVVNFAYRTIYDTELNGNRSGQTARALTRRYGAYALARELLHLLSDARLGYGHPPAAMDREMCGAFVNDCGFTALATGELELAASCFRRLAISERASGDVNRRLDALLSLALVLTSGGRMRSAARLLGSVERALAKSPDSNRAVDRLRQRTRSRQLQLDFVQASVPGSELRSRFLEYDRLHGITEIELLRTFILVLARTEPGPTPGFNGRRTYHADAYSVCLSKLMSKLSDGHHHDALELKVLLAGLMRERGDGLPAEGILDQAYRDILVYGCAERTFLRFLLEAGSNLAAQGQAYRAYCVYLRRCMRRSVARSYLPEAIAAARASVASLERLEASFRDLTAEEWSSMVDAEARIDSEYAKTFSVNDGQRSEYDPLYGFALAEASSRQVWLGSLEQVREELVTTRRWLSLARQS